MMNIVNWSFFEVAQVRKKCQKKIYQLTIVAILLIVVVEV